MDQDRIRLRKLLRRQGALLAASLVVLWLIAGQLAEVDLAQSLALFQKFSLWQWGLAAVFSAISIAAVAQYDRLIAGYMGLQLPARLTRAVGWRAAAMSQVIGLGSISGALIRWRLYGRAAEMSLWQATKMTAFVGIGFLCASFVLCAIAALVFGASGVLSNWIWATMLAGGILILALSLRSRASHALPNTRTILGALSYGAIDLIGAAAVIFVFLPEASGAFLTFAATYAFALNLGLLSSLPGGVGPFEAMLMAGLPSVDPESLLAAILAYRVIYFAVPALLAAPALLSPPKAGLAPKTTSPAQRAIAHPESVLIGRDGLSLQRDADNRLLGLGTETQNSAILFRDPVTGRDGLNAWRRAAHRSGRGACLYKTGRRGASLARGLGFLTLAMAQEAILDTDSFTTQGRAARQLRRKLNQASRAGIHVNNTVLPYGIAHEIDHDWQVRSGGARGFSMGRLSPDLLKREHVFWAGIDGHAMGFVSFMPGPDRWTLDLIRTRSDAPPGMTHALVLAGIEAARARGVAQVSLASVPCSPGLTGRGAWLTFCRHIFAKTSDFQGLYQFKQSFKPRWETEYLCLDGPVSGALAVWDLWQLIHHPVHLPPDTPNDPHNDYAFYEIASS